ncbi:MAG: FtsX-like permease family protein, partial [Chitinivibrionales bacterium]|nr:FtsX-like permease family protein [Chitinivibrionales bacterium]
SYNHVRFEIVGTIVPKDPDFKPWHWGWAVVMPLRTMQKYVTGYNPDPEHISLTVRDPEQFELQAEAISRELEQLHRGVRDFDYRGPDWADNMKETMGNISMVMGIISVVSLLVGGLGIMNVMLSSISERIREIGIRKALGARNSQICIQFLAETTTLSSVGGILGAALGLIPLLFEEAIKKSTQGVIAPTVLPEHVIFVFAVIVGVGVLFGLYPAVKASRMDPVEALRYE